MEVRVLVGRCRRSIVVITAVMLFYTLGGFLFLPWFLQHYLTHSLASKLQHTIDVKDVRFNPYLFKLQIDGLRILDVDSTPLVSLDNLLFDYEVMLVFKLGFGIEDFLLVNPYVKLEADGKGSYTILDMFADSPESAEEKAAPAAQPSSIPKLWLKNLLISGGKIDYHDASRAGGFSQTILLPNLSIKDFYTLQSAHANSVAIEVHDNENGVLRLETNVSLQPIKLNGSLVIENLTLRRVWQWLMLPVNFHLQAPRLDLSTKFDINVGEKLDLQTSQGSITLRDTAISDKASPEVPVIKLPVLSIGDMQMNLQQQSVVIGAIQANDGVLDVVLDKQGIANVQTLFSPVAQAAPSQAPASEPVKPWDVLIHQLLISNYAINLRDEKPKEPFALSLSPLSVAINEFKPLSTDKFAIQMKTGLASTKVQQSGTLSVDTQLQQKPFSVDAHVDLQQFPLPIIQPYVTDYVLANIVSGAAGAQLDIHFEVATPPKVLVKGSANVNKLGVHQAGADKDILAWNSLNIEGISFQLPENDLNIAKIALDKLDSGFVINADGTTNIQKLLVSQPSPPKKETSAPMKMGIEMIAINNADLGFADLTMKPNFKVAMRQLSGSIKGLSSNPDTQAVIDLKGKVDRYAPVTIKGKVNLLIAKPSLDAHMAFNNLELTTFTPYSGTYAGFKIEQGQLSLDIDYKLVNDKIQGKNKIVIDQLQLGSPVESKKAVDLPLRLAIALLKDENGVIDLGFEVGGDLNDPQFSIGGIIWKVVSNMIMKVVTSPFSALSALAGGADSEGVDQIIFEPGQDQLDEASLKKLQKVSVMLAKRSSLHVNVQGNALPDQDRTAIQSQKLINVLNENREIPAEAFLSSRAAVENGDAYKVVERYYDKHEKEDLDDVYDRIEDEMKARGEKPEKNNLKALAYEQGWATLQKGIPVSGEELDDLAMRRGKQVKANLVEVNHVAPERVFVLDANSDPVKASLTTTLILDAH
jgi:hypothetical protein